MAYTVSICRLTCGDAPVSPSAVDRKIALLSAAGLADRECERLRLIRRDEARRESVGARLALLWALGGYGGIHDFEDIPPQELIAERPLRTLGRGVSGEPQLSGYAVSLSHCDRLSVAVVREKGRIGVDVEPLDRPLLPHAADMVARYFTAGEKELLAVKENELPNTAAFLRIWTRKEAMGKARGEGLAHMMGLDTMQTSGEFLEDVVQGCLVSVYCEDA